MAGQTGRPGWMHVGPLEERLTRGWSPDTFPDAELLLAVMTLAAVPHALAARLAAHLTGGIYLGYGSVPDLPGFESLRSLRLPVQGASWDLTPGVYDPNTRRIGMAPSRRRVSACAATSWGMPATTWTATPHARSSGSTCRTAAETA